MLICKWYSKKNDEFSKLGKFGPEKGQQKSAKNRAKTDINNKCCYGGFYEVFLHLNHTRWTTLPFPKKLPFENSLLGTKL